MTRETDHSSGVPRPLATKLIESHRIEGRPVPGEEIGIRIDQTLTQDATGTLVMLELEAMGLGRVRNDLSVQYVDHNLIQEDHRNPDDHIFLRSACRRFGLWYSAAGNGVSHPVHQERFGVPGLTLLGSDSHTPAAGALGMLAIGAGGVEVALAMAGEPFRLRMPRVHGVRLTGSLPDFVSAKDVALEMLRRHGVEGMSGRIVEYHGEGLESLDAMDRHVIANMGTEMGATTTVFPADEEIRRFLARHGREAAWRELTADPDAEYDAVEEVDLSSLEPLIAMPSSPGNVERVADHSGAPIYQAYVGSSANPGYRDFAVAARIVADRQVPPETSFDINPTSRRILDSLARDGHLGTLIRAGARIHQAGCNGCIGMGQAPATGRLSLRTVPRNFPGRSGTRDDQVCLVSPETAAASAVNGVITDPRTLGERISREVLREPDRQIAPLENLERPLPEAEASQVVLEKGPNIASLPRLEPLSESMELPILLTVDHDLSTDEILPAGTRVLPWRSNIPKISEFAFDGVDPGYAQRAESSREQGGHAVVAGRNYGQGSSREHAALAPRYLGLRLVIAESYARIHRQNLINFGVLPLSFERPEDRRRLERGHRLRVEDLSDQLQSGGEITIRWLDGDRDLTMRHDLSSREIGILRVGGVIRWMSERLESVS